MISRANSDWPDPETYEFGLLQRIRHEFEPQGLQVCGTEGDEKHCVVGRLSLSSRQLDVAIYRPGEKKPFWIADAKRHTRRIDVRIVESFLGMMEDVGARIGLLVAPNGFSKAAVRRARITGLTLRIMTPDEALDFQWLPLVRSIFPWDWIFHPSLCQAIRRLKEKTAPRLVIDALEGTAFEEWLEFCAYALFHHRQEAIATLEMIALHHFDDGWRYNAIQLLLESDGLRHEIREFIQLKESDLAILELVATH